MIAFPRSRHRPSVGRWRERGKQLAVGLKRVLRRADPPASMNAGRDKTRGWMLTNDHDAK
ncbi:hypothetical protein NX02_03985 [Sphingomonas sanxanigenens DSM 19645 = NX02]|uniref:Uncharacterized protein n=1 Tax=Sphingomonas sanxanigenens DSM 19645 = NX02 TaxID=1123269 RepID=W0AA67_9SPHN|nr:hypothetical protein NX02_03985 [Sphingomonas sanxanigenens DSM 19645 = NX02]